MGKCKMATWSGNGQNSRTFVSNIKTGEGSWQVDLETRNHSEIKEMQQKLTSFGYSTQGADGTYGNNTKAAVINFQRAFPASRRWMGTLAKIRSTLLSRR